MTDEHFRTPVLMHGTHSRTSATNHFNRPFQMLLKNVFIRADITLSTLEIFLFNGLYKFTLLTYLLRLSRL